MAATPYHRGTSLRVLSPQRGRHEKIETSGSSHNRHPLDAPAGSALRVRIENSLYATPIRRTHRTPPWGRVTFYKRFSRFFLLYQQVSRVTERSSDER